MSAPDMGRANLSTKILVAFTTISLFLAFAAYFPSLDHNPRPYNDNTSPFDKYENDAIEPEPLTTTITRSTTMTVTATATVTHKAPTPTTPIIHDKVAVIIEDRPLDNLVPLVLHFASVLGPSWPIFMYTSAELAANLSAYPSLARWSHQIGIRTLPESQKKFDGHDSVSTFLTRPWIYEQLVPAKNVLVFQADSILCSNAPQSIEDFLAYDFVGAPLLEVFGQGYNGGLSLRNRQTVLDIIAEHDWEQERDEPNSKFEDQWFFMKMKDRPNIMLPIPEVAQKFSVETIYYDKPLGYHQIERWQMDHMEEIQKWCPEIKLAIKGSFA